jgi:hypothetical protein
MNTYCSPGASNSAERRRRQHVTGVVDDHVPLTILDRRLAIAVALDALDLQKRSVLVCCD